MVSGPNPSGTAAPPPTPTPPPAPIDLAVTYDRASGEMVLDNQSPTQQYSNVYYDSFNQQWYFDPGTTPTNWSQVGDNALLPLRTVGSVLLVAVQHGVIGDLVGYTFDAFGNISVIPQVGDALGSVGDTLGNLADQVPGEGWILGLIHAMYNLPQTINSLITQAETVHPMTIIQSLVPFTGILGDLIQGKGAELFQFVSDHTVGEFYSGMLNVGLEVDTSKFDAQAKQGVEVVDTMLGFSFLLQLAVAALDFEGKGILAGRWADSLKETIAKIPEELGISWVLGTAIEQGFEAAVGESIREGINKQKRGNRIAWQQLRVLLKQHILTDEQLTPLLENQGFPDEQIEWLRQLRDVQLPIGDLQQMYLQEIMTGAEVKKYISELGFAQDDVDRIFALYVDKAETSAGTTLRTTARALFTDQLIPEAAYRNILEDAHYPKREIDDDIGAVNLVHSVGKVQQSVGLIKSRYLHKLDLADAAIANLRALNYSLQYATELVASWDLPPIHPQHGLNQSKLLSYFISGLLTEQELRDGLAALNVNQKTIDFLVTSPSSSNGTRVLRLGPNMVLQAYVEGALTYQQLPDKFKSVGVQADDITLWIDKAVYRKSHTKGTTTYTSHLSEGQVVACFKWGMFDENTAHERLMQLGFSPDDATLILEIENKGVFQPPVPPVFATLGQAVDYLKMLGYGIVQPTDPKVLAAETMLAQAGYSWTMPSTTLPGGGLTGSGSGGLIDPITGLPIPPGTGTPPPGPVQPPI